MLLRPAGEDAVVAIGQASHAWVSGQLARAWGNADFPAPEPREEVCLAADQHDVGMALWDLAPVCHPGSGLPTQFFELDRLTHLALWTQAPTHLLTQSHYAALLVSLHGTGLYERFPPRTDDPGIARAVAEYLEGQRVVQDELAAQVGATPAELRRNQALLAAWDDLSLALCMARAPRVVPDVPSATGTTDLTLTDHGDHHTLEPWPLADDAVELRAEGRRLTGRFAGDADLQAALEAAPVVPLRITLRKVGQPSRAGGDARER
jgi:hypothetical protein